jgi:titin
MVQLTVSTKYYYRVRACSIKPWENSDFTDAVSATTCAYALKAPSSFVAIPSASTKIELAWLDNSYKEDGFEIERRIFGSAAFQRVAVIGPDLRQYVDAGLAAKTTYQYRIRAYNSAGYSCYSEASATTLAPETIPPAPTALLARAVSYSRIDISWTDNSQTEAGFHLERSLYAAFTSVDKSLPLPAYSGAGSRTYSDTSVSPSSTYYYRICAQNSAGRSGFSNTAGATTPAKPLPPQNPYGLVATSSSSSSISLAWSDNSHGETGFRLERSTSSESGFALVATLAANTVAYVNAGLSPSTNYYYRILAYNSLGNSAYSNTLSAATSGASATLIAPSNLAAASFLTTPGVALRWQDNSGDEEDFNILRSTSASGTYVLVTKVAAAPGAGTLVAYSDTTGLARGTTYYYKVQAHAGIRVSADSNIVSAKTIP